MASIKKGLVDIATEILEDIKNDSELIIRNAEKKAEEILRDAKMARLLPQVDRPRRSLKNASGGGNGRKEVPLFAGECAQVAPA